jgi:hypothetical protein
MLELDSVKGLFEIWLNKLNQKLASSIKNHMKVIHVKLCGDDCLIQTNVITIECDNMNSMIRTR